MKIELNACTETASDFECSMVMIAGIAGPPGLSKIIIFLKYI